MASAHTAVFATFHSSISPSHPLPQALGAFVGIRGNFACWQLFHSARESRAPEYYYSIVFQRRTIVFNHNAPLRKFGKAMRYVSRNNGPPPNFWTIFCNGYRNQTVKLTRPRNRLPPFPTSSRGKEYPRARRHARNIIEREYDVRIFFIVFFSCVDWIINWGVARRLQLRVSPREIQQFRDVRICSSFSPSSFVFVFWEESFAKKRRRRVSTTTLFHSIRLIILGKILNG